MNKINSEQACLAADDRYIQTAVNFGLNWSVWSYMTQANIKYMFSFYGYDIQINDAMTYEEKLGYDKLVIDLGMKEFEIRDMGEYILVRV